jgi:hypothetical protein
MSLFDVIRVKRDVGKPKVGYLIVTGNSRDHQGRRPFEDASPEIREASPRCYLIFVLHIGISGNRFRIRQIVSMLVRWRG